MFRNREKLIIHYGEKEIDGLKYWWHIDFYKNGKFQRTSYYISDEFAEEILRLIKKEWKEYGIIGEIVFSEKGQSLEQKVREYEP